MKVLLVGNGAREHALAKHLVNGGAELYSFMKHLNPGIAKLSKKYVIGNFTDFDNLLQFDVDFAVIGPEKPLSLGMTDYLQTLHIGVVGPTRAAGRLETSKTFARKLVDRHQPDANPKYFICKSIEELEVAIKLIDRVVIKPDGLTGGIGVKIEGIHLHSHDEIINYAKEILQEDHQFIVEEFLTGTEFTVQAFCDGSHIEPMPLVHDYRSPTIRHSLGSVTAPDHDFPGIEKRDIDKARNIIRDSFRAMYEEYGVMYQGILYGQFIKTESEIKLIEYNCRFGDPEALNVLYLLKDNPVDLFYNMTQNNMGTPSFKTGEATMSLYLVPKGFLSENLIKDSIIKIPELPQDIDYFYGAVYQEKPDGEIRTIHKRSLALFSHDSSIDEVRKKLYEIAPKIKGELTWSDEIGK
jgi:phosphoribosylamine--glycine ligase